MNKRFLHHLSPAVWASRLAIYSSGRLWREVWLQAARSRWAEVAAAIAFLWLLGLLGLSFVLLHIEQHRALPLPMGAGQLAYSVQTSLAIAPAEANPNLLGRWELGLLGLGAWLCLVAGSHKLMQLVAIVYDAGSPHPATWRTRLLPWGVTLLALALAGLVLGLTEGAAGPQPGLMAQVWRLGRWAIALVSIAIGLAVVYRLAPRRWAPGLPLWPGVRLVLLLGIAGLGLRYWGVTWLAGQTLAYGLLPALGLNLGALYGLILLVPLGAQVNLSALRHRGTVSRSWGMPPPTPPSFESFKINRRS
ncbi:YhjD/YihY/BrkB family envelope integrity protein [Nodosilinea sp. AN01ver1]|uniref:YhjD/YihY/BrkB family envelope integrity protein n=1 Tax=Nodosilinea sp. AN01ver1 TaxID=3423362 RepID=UPI003D321E1E